MPTTAMKVLAEAVAKKKKKATLAPHTRSVTRTPSQATPMPPCLASLAAATVVEVRGRQVTTRITAAADNFFYADEPRRHRWCYVDGLAKAVGVQKLSPNLHIC